MVRWIAIVVVALAAAWAFGGAAVPAGVRDLPQRAATVLRGDGGGQSGAQISPAEFVAPRRGETRERLRGLLGEPEAKATAQVEGVEVECWTYGISGASGAFQFCFANGRLSSRFRYGASG